MITTIGDAALDVLNAPLTDDKLRLTRQYAKAWFDGQFGHDFQTSPPDQPARPEKPELLMPRYMPKRRKIDVKKNMIALLHAVAHIEFNAINLAWDIVARFGKHMPREFTDDWVRVADDEARHFDLLTARLTSYGAAYGDLPAHDGLWQAAKDTTHDVKARLAIVPMVLEARGLDVTPAMIDRFKKAGDMDSAHSLKIIYNEEISHVFAGQKWFNYLCQKENINPEQSFQKLVRRYFKGRIKPPFNITARDQAGFDQSFYLPLSTRQPE